MPDLEDGQRVTVQGSGSNQYTLARDRAVYSCSCPAWRNMRMPVTSRRCKHLVAYLGDTALVPIPRPRPPPPPPPPAFARPQQPVATYDEEPALRTSRDAALTDAIETQVVLFDKMEEVYGLRLPRDLGYVAGFYLALRDDEKEELRCVTRGPIGIGAWFVSGGLEWDGDQRLRDRMADDPPELVPVMSGASDGERFALLYDEPSELPSGVVHRHGARALLCRPTLLETLRDRLDQAVWAPETNHARRRTILAWLDEVLRRARIENDEESALSFQSLGAARGSFTWPYVPGWSLPDDLMGLREHNERHAAYAAGASIVREWIVRANVELAEGSPGRALFLGRELHMSGSTAFRAEASELLIRAYSMLGRGPLLEIVRAQHLELHPEVPLYELPPPHGIVSAAASADAAGIALAWSKYPPTETDVEEALKRAASVEVFDAIFDRIDVDARERASRAALGRRLSQMLRLPPRSPERSALAMLIGRFVERSQIDARAFERILVSREPELTSAAARTVDLDSTSQGATPLHIAARAAQPDVVRVLIDRGADVRAKNGKGRMAFDEANSPVPTRDAQAVLLMLEAAGGGVGKVPTRAWSDGPSWSAGDKVHHAKFGDGVVEKVDGSGADAKLQIRFGKKDVKTLMGKFVERR